MNPAHKSRNSTDVTLSLIAELERLGLLNEDRFGSSDQDSTTRVLSPQERVAPVVFAGDGWDKEFTGRVQAVEEQVSQEGTEALAWYTPFHLNRKGWGIYIREEGLAVVSRILECASEPQPSAENPLTAAYELLYRHEYFHHLAEVACGILEVLKRRAMADSDEEVAARVVSRLIGSPYQQYRQTAKCNPQGALEESVANAYAIQTVPDGAWREAIWSWFKTQPAAYREFDRYESGVDFLGGLRELSRLHRRAIWPEPEEEAGAGLPDAEALFDCGYDGFSVDEVPVRIVRPARSGCCGLQFIRAIPAAAITESDLFAKDIKHFQLRAKAEKAKRLLGIDFRHRSLNTEWIRGHEDTFSIRLDHKYRASIKRCGASWKLLRANSHDELYRSPGT
jgi:hypothetical protein